MRSDIWPAWRLRENFIVQNYSGSSVSDSNGIKKVAQRIVDTRRAGNSVVVVLPEMENATNEILHLTAEVAPWGPSRELDHLLNRGERISVALLVLAISNLGADPHVFAAGDAGMIMDGIRGKAHLVGVNPKPVLDSLARGEIPIVAGFQGPNHGTKPITTMERDGSDRMAVALAASLNAGVCEFYSDIDGVYTADPRIVPTARKVDTIPSGQMMELAAGGARVLHPRCIEYARRLGVTIHVRSLFDPSEGTFVVSRLEEALGVEHSATLEEPIFVGVTQDRSQVQVTVTGVPMGSGSAAQIFSVTAAAGVCADMITHGPAVVDGYLDISFILPGDHCPAVVAAVSKLQKPIGFHSLESEEVGKLSLVGFGLRADPDVLCRFLSVLSEVGIKTRLLSDSAVAISAVTDLEMLDLGAHAIREEFGLSADLEKGYVDKYVNHSIHHKI
jgi:aspartate kinase